MEPLRDEMKVSWRALLLLAILFAFLILASLQDCEARGARSSRNSRVRSSSKTKGKSSSSSSKPIKQKTFHSSVTRRQLKLAKKRPFNERFKTRAAIGITAYTLLNSPIHSGYYKPYHETSNIVIPKHRALKIAEENYTVLANDGSRCQEGKRVKYDEKNVVNITTKVTYTKAKLTAASIPAVKMTDTKQTNLTLSADAIKDYIVNIETRIAFNESILEISGTASNGTVNLSNCTIFLYESQAYVVESFALKNKANLALSLLILFVSIVGLK